MESWSELIRVLLVFAAQSLSESPDLPAPPILRLDQQHIAQIVCGQPCPARAVYLGERGILIDAALDPATDAYARSILLHELVHHVQRSTSRYSDLSDCQRWNAREREAYAVQRRYLAVAQSGIMVRALLSVRC